MSTNDNNRFLKNWTEVNLEKVYFNCNSLDEAKISSKKWFPYSKGGEFRRWSGNDRKKAAALISQNRHQ
jgi:hypothetical protein